jgi:hypothetical protein
LGQLTAIANGSFYPAKLSLVKPSLKSAIGSFLQKY